MTRGPLIDAYRWISARYPVVPHLNRALFHREWTPPFRRIFARDLHEAIKREVGDIRGGFFFEAGAYDGVLFSNTAYLEEYLGWTGLLVEAVPHQFVSCVRNRPGSAVEHCALVAPDYRKPYVELRYADLMSFSPDVSSVNGTAHVRAASEYLPDWGRRLLNQTFFAPAMTLGAVLDKHGVDHIDLMVLDLEGSELNALKGLDFGKIRIERLLVEALSGPAEIDAFLQANGFRRAAKLTFRDYLYRPV